MFILLSTCCSVLIAQSKLLIPMDLKQTDHLKSYGVAFWLLEKNGEVDWLLNYRGGSFMMDYSDVLAQECRVRGVFFESLAAGTADCGLCPTGFQTVG
jgi:hypothetical protein